MLVTTARYETPNGSKYLQQLCKHFAHRSEVDFDATSGRANLSSGPAELSADDTGLNFRLTAEDAKGLIHARYIVESHLVTFAHRENFTGLAWQVEGA